MRKPDMILKCRKCEHHLYVRRIGIKWLERYSKTDCPNCGEEGDDLWILSRRGNYEAEYGPDEEDENQCKLELEAE